MTEKITLKPGESYHYSFINHNKSTNPNAWNWVLPVYNSGNDSPVIVLRSDNWEDNEKKDAAYGSNAGCLLISKGSDNVWADYMNQMDGAAVDMTVTYTAGKVINVDCDITTSGGYSWKYTYTSDYAGSTRSFTGDVQLALSISNSWLQVLDEGYSAVAATIGSAGYATYVSNYDLDYTGISGLTAYKVSVDGSKAILSPVTEVPAGAGVVLKGSAGTYRVPMTTDADELDGNALVRGTGSAVQTTADGKNNYVLSTDNDGNNVGFYQANGETVPTNRAYLQTTATGARLTFVFEDETTGISDASRLMDNEEMRNDNFFNLNGQKVSQPTKGLYIKNGKKVVIK